MKKIAQQEQAPDSVDSGEEATMKASSLGDALPDGDDFRDEHTTTNDEESHQKATDKSYNPAQSQVSETVLVRQAELLTIMTMIYAAAGLGVTVRVLTDAEAGRDFSEDFRTFSRELFDDSQRRLDVANSMLSALSVSILANAETRNETLPFLTLLDFDARTAPLLEATDALLVAWIPLVASQQIDSWNDFVFDNRGSASWEPLAANENRTLSAPLWEFSPLSKAEALDLQLNEDRFDYPPFNQSATAALAMQSPILTPITVRNFTGSSGQRAISSLLFPVIDGAKNASVGIFELVLDWATFFEGAVPLARPLDLESIDTCGNAYTFNIVEGNAIFLKEGRFHDKIFDARFHEERFAAFGEEVFGDIYEWCKYTIRVFPTAEFENNYQSEDTVFFALLIGGVFSLMIGTFILYACVVRTRQRNVMTTVEKTTALVSSIFPETVQERIFQEASEPQERSSSTIFSPKMALKAMFGELMETPPPAIPQQNWLKGKPIADLFTNCTVMFADIVGFTAWSSTREPSQVFMLLETIYQEFDEIAGRRRVFKVETVGDCYVAVAGLPEPRKDHHVAMARFADDCLSKFKQLVKDMVLGLGPDTEDLKVRIGLHSGPVTAGVLRGERARFQLFGDTVNTTARMESTGIPNFIHISKDTADLLMESGKGQWIRPRREKVVAKGKGELQTYWLHLGRHTDVALSMSFQEELHLNTDKTEEQQLQFRSSEKEKNSKAAAVEQEKQKERDDKLQRLIAWNVDVLLRALGSVIARRKARGVRPDPREKMIDLETDLSENHLILKEAKEIVTIPAYQAPASSATDATIPAKVKKQLHGYIEALAAMYNDNPFHNFEHASHVTMSVCKLLGRIVAPDYLHERSTSEATLHDHTYGITSDPLTQFAVILSALIHDADHPGVSNAQLIKEDWPIANVYQFKSIAEQNSVDLAWRLLMQPNFEDLRQSIYATGNELKRFRQLIVNVVMATDIMDKELKSLRNDRWERAFSEAAEDDDDRESENRKATIVLEHLIQASDVAHTMQHWHVYRKWNSRLFAELHKSFAEGRLENDPALGWYKGEIGFFDFYIIPLCKKLKDCGVFGVSSDEYLNYAMQNRAEWERKGQQITAELAESVGVSVGITTQVEQAPPTNARVEQAPPKKPLERKLKAQDSFDTAAVYRLSGTSVEFGTDIDLVKELGFDDE